MDIGSIMIWFFDPSKIGFALSDCEEKQIQRALVLFLSNLFAKRIDIQWTPITNDPRDSQHRRSAFYLKAISHEFDAFVFGTAEILLKGLSPKFKTEKIEGIRTKLVQEITAEYLKCYPETQIQELSKAAIIQKQNERKEKYNEEDAMKEIGVDCSGKICNAKTTHLCTFTANDGALQCNQATCSLCFPDHVCFHHSSDEVKEKYIQSMNQANISEDNDGVREEKESEVVQQTPTNKKEINQ